MTKNIAAVALMSFTLLVATCAFPVEEDTIVGESILVQEVVGGIDDAPVDPVAGTKVQMEAAMAKKEEQQAEAKKAGALEDKYTKEEEGYAAKVKASNKEMAKMQRDSAAAVAKSNKDAKDYAAQAMEKITETNKASAAAAARAAKLKEKYDKIVADMGKQDAAAKAKSEADAKKLKADMASLKKQAEDEKAAGKKIQEDMKNGAAALKKQQAEIKSSFEAKKAEMKAEKMKDEAKFEKEKKDLEGKFAKEFKSAAARVIAEKARLRAEAKNNKKHAKAVFKGINKKYHKKEVAMKKADKEWKAKEAADAKALKAKRAKTQESFKKKAAKADEDYKKDMAAAAVLKHEADHAMGVYNASVKQSQEEQKKADAIAKKNNAEDAAMAACNPDGSECQEKDGTCKKITPKGPYLASDLVACTGVKPKEQPYAGEKWAGVAPPPKLKKPVPSAACKAKHKALMATPLGKFMATNPKENPMEVISCTKSKKVKPAERKQAFEQFFDMAAACPPWCLPGTATNDGLNQDTFGTCIDPADMLGFKQQITDLPVYKNMGTNGKIPAGPPADLCRMAKAFISGVLGGADIPMPKANGTNATVGNATVGVNGTKKSLLSGHGGAVSMPFRGVNADADNWREDKYAASAPYAAPGMGPAHTNPPKGFEKAQAEAAAAKALPKPEAKGKIDDAVKEAKGNKEKDLADAVKAAEDPSKAEKPVKKKSLLEQLELDDEFVQDPATIAEAVEQKKRADTAKQLEAKRAATEAKLAAQKAHDDKVYQKAEKQAHQMKMKADQAEGLYQNSAKLSIKEQKEIEGH